jgi:hypothetical protein
MRSTLLYQLPFCLLEEAADLVLNLELILLHTMQSVIYVVKNLEKKLQLITPKLINIHRSS